jgi:hypothetical protein
VYGALLRLDAFDSDGAVASLRELQDRRLLPILAGALMAAGRYDSAISVLSRVSPDETDALRSWVIEQTAYSHLRQGESSLAQREYNTLAVSSYPAVRDNGVAGLIDVALADGQTGDMMIVYKAAFSEAPGSRSASKIAGWLQKQGRVSEAIDVLTQLSDSETAYDSECAWALLQLESLHHRNGDTKKSVAAGWRLQSIAPPGDRSGEAGLKTLIAALAGSSTASAFPDAYRRFLEANPSAADPARQIAFAAELQREHRFDAAAALYEEVSSDTRARRTDRTAALLALQRLLLESGQAERSVQIGMAIHESFPQELGARLSSWQLLRAASRVSGTRNSGMQDLEHTLAEDLRSAALRGMGSAKQRAQALLLQFSKEINQQ